jgi:CoA-transferase family III
MEIEAEVDAIVTGWTRERTKHEAMAQLSAVGVPGAVFDSMELTNEPSFRQRGILQTMRHGERTHFGGVLAEQWPRVDGGRDAVEAPRPGGHRHRLPIGSVSTPLRGDCVTTASCDALAVCPPDPCSARDDARQHRCRPCPSHTRFCWSVSLDDAEFRPPVLGERFQPRREFTKVGKIGQAVMASRCWGAESAFG